MEIPGKEEGRVWKLPEMAFQEVWTIFPLTGAQCHKQLTLCPGKDPTCLRARPLPMKMTNAPCLNFLKAEAIGRLRATPTDFTSTEVWSTINSKDGEPSGPWEQTSRLLNETVPRTMRCQFTSMSQLEGHLCPSPLSMGSILHPRLTLL